MKRVKIENGSMIYKSMFKEVRVPLENIVWGYLKIKDVNARMCCGNYNTEIVTVVFREASGQIHSFEDEEGKSARRLLKEMEEKNPFMAVGFTEENKARFQMA